MTGGFDPTAVSVIRIDVEAGSGFGTSWQSPATLVYIDSIVSSNGALMDTFDTDPTMSSPALVTLSGARTLTGSTVTWLATFP